MNLFLSIYFLCLLQFFIDKDPYRYSIGIDMFKNFSIGNDYKLSE